MYLSNLKKIVCLVKSFYLKDQTISMKQRNLSTHDPRFIIKSNWDKAN